MDRPIGLHVWDPAGSQSLAAALAPPVIACVEAGADLAAEIESAGSHLSLQSLLLSVSTAVACEQNVGLKFTAEIGRRLELPACLLERLTTAVHEATTNAAMHGNLMVESSLRESLTGLDALREAMQQRLSDPVMRKRRVRLRADWDVSRIVISVHDDGAGYGVDEVPQDVSVDDSKSGRGIALLSALSNGVALSAHSRIVHLFFDRQ